MHSDTQEIRKRLGPLCQQQQIGLTKLCNQLGEVEYRPFYRLEAEESKNESK